jgi:hypothetical protein
MAENLTTIIDPIAMKSILAAEFARDPSLLDEIQKLLVENPDIRQPSALFNYLFIAAGSETVGAIYPVVGFRLRNAQERLAALGALNRKEGISGLHQEATSR